MNVFPLRGHTVDTIRKMNEYMATIDLREKEFPHLTEMDKQIMGIPGAGEVKFKDTMVINKTPDIDFNPTYKRQTAADVDQGIPITAGPLSAEFPVIKDMKYDSGKLLAAIPFEDFPLALKEIAKISTYGAVKYERSSWKTVSNKEIRYKDAMFRHLLEMMAGEELDDESKLLHHAHFAWNVLALLQLKLEKDVQIK